MPKGNEADRMRMGLELGCRLKLKWKYVEGGGKLLEAITFLSFPLPTQRISNSNQIINILCVALHWEKFDCDYEIIVLLMKTNVIRFWSHVSRQAERQRETKRYRGRR